MAHSPSQPSAETTIDGLITHHTQVTQLMKLIVPVLKERRWGESDMFSQRKGSVQNLNNHINVDKYIF